ncbi:hypothetical protein Poli38472_014351 [Pythium oligandrum]|uniref:Uncharacterized protein n=1 Tax=Pythium oligandrum TaxID=41045 RepID=A0A8K1FGG0_PYTOL|nr:hypothetical protein Poli38472_014351 [Pythium oligandrum]|eukprot:TMW57748.1 hypothetical protein Poli38472_014351 [Pythium oligandrum]
MRRRHRRQWMVMMEVVEVSLQAITLRNLLLRGHQLPLIFVYVVLIVLNCATTFYFVSIDWTRDFSDEMTVGAILDMCFAVFFFPATQLAYAIKTFRGDFEMLRIRQHIIELVRKKSRKIAEIPDTKSISPKKSVVRMPSTVSKAIHTQVSGIPSIVGILFLFTGIVLSVLAAKAVNTSTMLCGSYASSCPVYPYHSFMEDSKAACPCLAFISQSINPIDKERVGPPPEIMTNLSIHAEAGTLRTIQIINRDLNPSLPPAVQNCVHLQQL